jgi:hypothetical protein
MTYGNTASEQITYNARLEPATYTLNNMNYQNTNVCCAYPTYSTMTWTYGYYNDGRVEHAWDSTNEWFDRAYKYDHAGRLKEASTFRRARGSSPYPAVSYPDPYYQNISYDAFSHSSRSGLLYTGQPPSDAGTYLNNRRTDAGWVYDADGNNTRDENYDQTYDASGTINHSVSHAMVGDGVQYPLEPRLDITQTYDGVGLPVKRDQISRQPGIYDQYGNQGEPIVDAQTTYYVNSSVLGGAIVAELGGANTAHIYAAGERIAREESGSVSFEQHNPVTGSWVKSNGHSTYRTTTREERDPRGAELPLSDPYPSAMTSYVDLKFSEPLFIEGGDPYDYSGGCTSFGMPISCSDAAGYIGRGLGQVDGIGFSPTNPRSGQGNRATTTIVDQTLIQISYVWMTGYLGTWTYYRDTVTRVVTVPDPNQKPQNPFDEPGIERTVIAAVQTKSCIDFANTVLGAQKRASFGTLVDVAKSFFALPSPRFTRNPPPGSTGGIANPIGRISVRTAQIYSLGDATLSASAQLLDDADSAISELFHLAARGPHYTDQELANAVNNSPYAADAYSLMSNGHPLIDPRSNIFDRRYIPDKKDKYDREHSFSRYFHTIQKNYCTSKPGFERGVSYQP